MAFSIPQAIHPVYSVPAHSPANNLMAIGSSVKDMSLGAETTMKKANDIAVAKAHEYNTASAIQFDKDLKTANITAQKAEKSIGSSRMKKMICITAVVACVIAVVGVIVATAMTGTWPLLFIATPFLIGLVPASYYTDIFRKNVSALEKDIAAPKNMTQPHISIPVYNPDHDMDLQESRVTVQNRLAQKTLEQLSNVNVSKDNMINYALLDRVTVISTEKRPAFYAKTIQLIEAYGKVVREHNEYKNQANRTNNEMEREIHKWKRQQDSHLDSQEADLRIQEDYNIRCQEARRHGEPVPMRPAMGTVLNLFTRWEIDSQRANVSKTYGRRCADISVWHQTTLNNINNTYNQAIAELDRQFAEAKAMAA